MIYRTGIRNNLSTCCAAEFIADKFERRNLMEPPAASVDGAVPPQAVTFAYQVDSSSDSTRRLVLSRAVIMTENVGGGPKIHCRYTKRKVYGLKFTLSERGVSVQKLVPSFYWRSQPDGICPRKCKCLTGEKQRARPVAGR